MPNEIVNIEVLIKMIQRLSNFHKCFIKYILDVRQMIN